MLSVVVLPQPEGPRRDEFTASQWPVDDCGRPVRCEMTVATPRSSMAGGFGRGQRVRGGHGAQSLGFILPSSHREAAHDPVAEHHREQNDRHDTDQGGGHHLAEYGLVLAGEGGDHQRYGLGRLARPGSAQRRTRSTPPSKAKTAAAPERGKRDSAARCAKTSDDAGPIDRSRLLQPIGDAEDEKLRRDPDDDRKVEGEIDDAEREEVIRSGRGRLMIRNSGIAMAMLGSIWSPRTRKCDGAGAGHGQAGQRICRRGAERQRGERRDKATIREFSIPRPSAAADPNTVAKLAKVRCSSIDRAAVRSVPFVRARSTVRAIRSAAADQTTKQRDRRGDDQAQTDADHDNDRHSSSRDLLRGRTSRMLQNGQRTVNHEDDVGDRRPEES